MEVSPYNPIQFYYVLKVHVGYDWIVSQSYQLQRQQLGLASAAFLGSECRWTYDQISLSQYRDSSNLEDKVPAHISPRNRVTQLNPQVPVSHSLASYDSQSYGGGWSQDKGPPFI
jgi:hypothetical protein